ncbi:restriction endonuclease [Parabacteroides sp. N37]|uniref:Restriction endonuclease n=1 Tax=Parabacteroides hominis TaxID=2763057 RepID=A0ABR7DKI9_9BACT|nr:restriction endonuclease [Parabacteroides hominis]MBC5631882.1 restriction endonuclease [Parabacteroides hominis]
MKKVDGHITVFEHETLRSDRGEKRLSQKQLGVLQTFYGEDGVPYYSLVHHGVKFNEYVGVIQIGKTIIEVLPKADKSGDENTWRNVLISMLRAVGVIDIHAPSSSDLQLRANSVLDLYFELFVKELEYLLHRGLVKKYRKTEGNLSILKGTIHFAKHINQNIVHQERFYVKHYTYDKQHDIHAILYKTLKLLKNIHTHTELNSRIGTLLLDFPELYDVKVTKTLFERISLDRKTEPYRKALEISRLLLLNYHPDVRKGDDNVLALMFDMNALWEQFVYVSIRKFKDKETTIAAQSIKNFWKPNTGHRSRIRPDIVLNKGTEKCVVLDTKWKNLNGHNPVHEDLRQMFVYMKYFGAKKVALVYPGIDCSYRTGKYYEYDTYNPNELSENECGVISIGVDVNVKRWQMMISDSINKLLE